MSATTTPVFTAVPATLTDTNADLIALITPADLFNSVEVGGVTLTGWTKTELWTVADILTTPGLSTEGQWTLINIIRDARAAAKKAAAAKRAAKKAA